MHRPRDTETFFFYGTLMDADVRAAVLGNLGADATGAADSLEGWQRVGLRGRTYPVIVPAPGAVVEGLVVSFADGTGKAVTDLLISFEGAEYALETLTLLSGEAALVFVGSRHCHPTGRPWSLSNWELRHKRAFLAGIRRGRLV